MTDYSSRNYKSWASALQVAGSHPDVYRLMRRAAKTEAALLKLREMAGNSPRDYEFASEGKLRALGLWREPKP
jgi:hypothetical protein